MEEVGEKETENGTELALEVVTASGTGTGSGAGPELELKVLPVCGDATRHW